MPTPPPIERIPFFGTTWYKRGGAYWARRVLAAVLMLLAFVVSALMTFGLGYGLWRQSIPLSIRIIALVVIAAAIVRSSIKTWSGFVLVGRSRQARAHLQQWYDAHGNANPFARTGR
jgi:hypothetical protein